MRVLHMLHKLDVSVGEETSTVRNGFKWADLKIGEEIELCVCYPTPQDHHIVGVGAITNLWFGYFSDVPSRLIANEHEIRSRSYFGLLESMRKAYPGFTEFNPVTVVSYERIK